jgi:hypothetical protein
MYVHRAAILPTTSASAALTTMPATARRALARLSGLSLTASANDDIGSSIHIAMDKACERFQDWGLLQFEASFRYADLILIDRDLGVPTDDCREMAHGVGSEVSVLDEIHHEGSFWCAILLPPKKNCIASSSKAAMPPRLALYGIESASHN